MPRFAGTPAHDFGADPIVVAYGMGGAAKVSANAVRGKAAEGLIVQPC